MTSERNSAKIFSPITFGEGMYLAYIEEVGEPLRVRRPNIATLFGGDADSDTDEGEVFTRQTEIVIRDLARNQEMRRIRLPNECDTLVAGNNLLLCFSQFSHQFLFVVDPSKENPIVQKHKIKMKSPIASGDYLIYGSSRTDDTKDDVDVSIVPELKMVKFEKLTRKNFLNDEVISLSTTDSSDRTRGIEHIAVSGSSVVVAFHYELQFLDEAKKIESKDQKQDHFSVCHFELSKNFKFLFSGTNPIAVSDITDFGMPYGTHEKMKISVLDSKRENGFKSNWFPDLPAERGSVFCLIPGEQKLLVSYQEGSSKIMLWDVEKKEQTEIDLKMPIRALFVEPNSGILGIVPMSGSPIAYDLEARAITDFKKAKEYKEGVLNLALHFIPSAGVVRNTLSGYFFGDVRKQDSSQVKQELRSPKNK